MATNVTLSGGPRAGATVAIDGPWPRSVLYVDDLVGGVATYDVDNENGPAPYTATWVDPATLESGEEFFEGQATGPMGPTGPEGPPGPQGFPGEAGVGFTPVGEYDPLTEYSFMDVVFTPVVVGEPDSGATYYSLVDFNVGNPVTDDEFWAVLSARGAQGDPGPEGPAGDIGPQGDPGSPLPTRDTVAIVTSNLAVGAAEVGTVPIALGYRVLKIEADHPARIRFYTTEAKRDADAGRGNTEDPVGDHGVVVETILVTGLLALDLSPVPQGYSMEAVPTTDVPFRIDNPGPAANVITVTVTYQIQEA